MSTETSSGARTLADLFVLQVERAPDGVALRFRGADLTFLQLDRWSDEICRRLQRGGVRSGQLVGLCTERSPGVVAALVGLLKSGASYVALDPEVPPHRRARILSDASPVALLGTPDLLAQLETNIPGIILPDSSEVSAVKEPRAAISDDALFHIVYTSGTTGQPKGVRVLHRCVRNRLEWMWGAYPFAQNSVMGIQKSYALVASPWEMLGGLLCGIPSVLLTREEVLDPIQLYENVARERITHLFLNPPLIESLVEEHERRQGKLSLSLVTSGADVLPVELVRRFQRCFPGVTLLNLYGMTECSSNVAAFDAANLSADAQRVPVGRPIGGAVIKVVDAANRALPVGVQGQIVVSGPAVADGYHGDLTLTEQRFRRDSHGTVWYQTGDYGRWLRNGDLELLGRLDNQVQIRGYRVEIEEVELAIRSLPAVTDAGVTVVRKHGQLELAAFVCGQIADLSTLREALLQRLPEYMAPTSFTHVDALPITAGGKLDRASLAMWEPRAELAQPVCAVELTVTEKRVAKLWEALLGAPPASAQADFFAAGGHSLLAVRLISRMRAEFKRPVPLSLIFENARLCSLAAAMESGEATQKVSVAPLVPQQRGGVLPLSFAQERLWFLDQLGLVGSAYNLSMLLNLEGALETAALERSFAEIIARHEILRTRFEAVAGNPAQVIAPPGAFVLGRVDLSALEEDPRGLQFEQQSGAEARRPFDLAKGPLLRATLYKLAPRRHILLLVMHHIVFDGASLNVLNGELEALYEAYSRGEPSPLPPLPIQYVDYAVWQRQSQGDLLQKQQQYWKARLGDIPPDLRLATDRYRPRVPSFKGDKLSLHLPAVLFQALEKRAREDGATWFMLFLAAYQILLCRYSGQTDVVVGSFVTGRENVQAEGLIGFFLNTLLLRTDLSGMSGFRQVLARVKENTLRDYAHQELPFEQLVMQLRPQRDLSHQPLFQVAIAQNLLQKVVTLPDLTWDWRLAQHGQSLFDLTMFLNELPDGLHVVFEYSTDLFERATIERMAAHLRGMLEQIAANPDCTPALILPEDEREQVIELFNRSGASPPHGDLIHRLVEEQAARGPDVEAVRFQGQSLSYGELNRQANQLARHLKKQGIGPDALVAVCLERSFAMIVGLLGILKAGGAYVPLDPAYPSERLAYMLEDAAPKVLLTQGKLTALLPGMPQEVVLLDVEPKELATHSGDNLPSAESGVGGHNLVYVIYTSGSTGQPKGTAMTHGATANLLDWQHQQLDAKGQRVLQFAALSFDVSFQEIFSTLCTGGTLVLVDDWVRRDPRTLLEILQSERIERAFLPPLMLESLAEYVEPDGDAVPLSLNDVITAGEQLRITPRISRFFARLMGCRLHNHYGPTETHVVTALTLRGDPDQWPALPAIGKPISNTQIYVLDSQRQPVPIGVTGEICIAGVALARGYLNRPEVTAERFVRDPFSADPTARLYRTGDLGRWRADGTLEYLGRDDDQVKVRGFRIELKEIEAQLIRHAQVKEAAVVVYDDGPVTKRIVAYIAHRGEGAPSIDELRMQLRAVLPEYMVPAAFVVLERLPLTPSGKLDRRALPSPQLTAYVSREYEAPKGEVEEILAGIWQELLSVDRVGRQDRFFDLGGHSLLAVRVMARIREQLSVELPLQALFDAPTVQQLAAELSARVHSERAQEALRLGDLTQQLREEIGGMHEDAVLARIAELENELAATAK